MNDSNYLKQELYELVKNDSAIFEFFQSGSLDGIWYWDLENPEHEWMSPQFWESMGYEPGEKKHLASEWQDLINKDDLQTALDNFKKHCEDPFHPYDQIVRYRHKDGSTVWVRCRGIAIRDDNGKPVRLLGAHTNITELKRAENELVNARQLESLGLLAGGIAHDFNNLLTGILGNIQLARLEYSPSLKAQSYLYNAESALEKASELANRLLTFSKGGEPMLECLDVREILSSALAFSLKASSVLLHESYEGYQFLVSADRGQFTQVVNNVVENALQAMPRDGILDVDVSAIEFSTADPETGLVGEYVRIRFSDNGVGIPKDNLDKLFIPYFSTRAMGSGLGLATVFSILRRHNGGISVSSVPGEGAVFSIFLPVFSGNEASDELNNNESSDVRDSAVPLSPRILLMDDDEMIRRITEKLLSHFGLELDFASHGGEAVQMYREAYSSDSPYSVVLIDLTNPSGAGGREIIRKLKEIDPQLKSVVVSGYTTDPVMTRPEEYGFSGSLAKPFKLSDMKRVLRESCGLDV